MKTENTETTEIVAFVNGKKITAKTVEELQEKIKQLQEKRQYLTS